MWRASSSPASRVGHHIVPKACSVYVVNLFLFAKQSDHCLRYFLGLLYYPFGFRMGPTPNSPWVHVTEHASLLLHVTSCVLVCSFANGCPPLVRVGGLGYLGSVMNHSPCWHLLICIRSRLLPCILIFASGKQLSKTALSVMWAWDVDVNRVLCMGLDHRNLVDWSEGASTPGPSLNG